MRSTPDIPNHNRLTTRLTPADFLSRGNGHQDAWRIYATPPGTRGRFRIPLHLTYPDTSLGQMFEQTAQRFGGAPAVVCGDVRWTYHELRTRIHRIAGGLAGMGVRPGDRVMMTLPNCPEFVVSFFAVQKLGAILVNAGPLMGADDMATLIGMTRPRVIITLDIQAPDLMGPAKDAPKTCWLWVSLKTYQPVWKKLGYRYKIWQAREHLAAPSCQATFDQFIDQAPAVPPSVAPEAEDTAVLQPTGGTTGTLKVAQLTHRNLLANATQVSTWAGFNQGQDRVLAVLPMFHVYGLTTSLIMPVLNAAVIIPVTRFKTDPVLAMIREHSPTFFALVPAILDAFSNAFEKRPDPKLYEALRDCTLISGAAPLMPATAERFEAITGASVIQGYGLTEASPVTHANLPGSPRSGSIGLPLPDTLARVADLDDPERDAKPGEAGELWVSGPQVMLGYLNNPQETALVLSTDDDGRRWLHTGDVVRVDEDGYVYVLDRRKHMINHAGLKVWPGRVEQVIGRHPGVADVAVVGRPDPVYTESVAAIVVPKDPGLDTGQLSRELNALCHEHLSKYEAPVSFEFTDQLPRSALGKLMKHRIGAPETAAVSPKNAAAQQAMADDDRPTHHTSAA